MTGSLIVVLALVFAALFMLALLMTGSMSGGHRGRDVADRIERYGPRHAPAPAGRGSSGAGGAVGWVTSLLQSTNSERGLAERLDLAGSGRRPAEWVLLGIGGSALLAAALTLATGNLLIGVLGGALIGWLGMHAVLSIRIGRRRAAFSDQLPDVLQLIAGSLQSGFSLPQAVDAVVREGTQPAADEFSRALAEARIGADLEDALSRVADRMDSTDLRWTVMAIRIQREVGGNLAEVLRTTVGTMRERAFLRRQVSALSAEGRLSAYVLVALPVALGAWFFYSDPSYMRPLYTTLIGLVMLVGSAALVVVGAFWMRRLIKIEV
jgi:tight adherence protein B